MTDADRQSSKPDKPQPRRRRRWWLRILVSLAVLLILVIVAVQVVLWSSIPRSIIIAALQKALGVKVEASSVQTGWWGHTSVSGVKMTIPLDNGTFVDAPKISVEHSSLISLAIFGLELKSLTIDRPEVYLRQSPTGRWNAVDMLEGMGRSAASGQGTGSASGAASRPKIPAIDINDAQLHFSDQGGRKMDVGPVRLTGKPDATAPELVWQYVLALPQQLEVSGRVATGGEWRSEAKLAVMNLRPLLSPFMPNPPDIKLAATWDGRASGGVQGRLAIERASLNSAQGQPVVSVKGVVNVQQSQTGVVVKPDGLTLLNAADKEQLTLAEGEIALNGGVVSLKSLVARLNGAVAKANGSFTPAAMSGDLAAEWVADSLPAGYQHDGKLVAKVRRTFDGRLEMNAGIDTVGKFTNESKRKWNGRIDIAAAGDSFQELGVTISVPKFDAIGPRSTFKLDGLQASLVLSQELAKHVTLGQEIPKGAGIALRSLKLADTDLMSASGFYLFDKLQPWQLQFTGKALPIPTIAPDALGVSARLAGDQQIIHIAFDLAGGDSVLAAKGSYQFKPEKPKPLDLAVTLNHAPPGSARDSQTMGGKPTSPPLLEGVVAGEGMVSGTVSPMQLDVVGNLQGVNVRSVGRDLGNISVEVVGNVNEKVAKLKRNPDGPKLELLGGEWDIEAVYDRDEESADLQVNMKDLPLKEVGDLIGPATKLQGVANGTWNFGILGFKDIAHQIRGGGHLHIEGPSFNDFKLDSIDVQTLLENGKFGLSPLEVRLGKGQFTARTEMSVDDLKRLEILDLHLVDWPVSLPPATFLTVNASAPRVGILMGQKNDPRSLAPSMTFESGPITAESRIQLGDVDAGTARLNIVLDQRKVHVPLVTAELLGSRLEGKATADLNEPNRSTAALTWNNIQPSNLKKLAPGIDVLTGAFDIEAAVWGWPEYDPLGPLVVDAQLRSRDVYYRQVINEATTPTTGVRLGDGFFRTQVRLDPHFEVDRAVLTDQSGTAAEPDNNCPPRRDGPLPWNTLEMAGGQATLWARLVRNENDRGQPGLTTYTSHLRLGFHCLDVNQILQAVKPDKKPVKGVIDGNLVLQGTSKLERTPKFAAGMETAAPIPSPLASQALASQPATTQVAADQLPQTHPSEAARPDAMPNAATSPMPTTEPAKESFLQRTLRAMQGSGSLSLRRSDLVNIKLIDRLYALIHFANDSKDPQGKGDLAFRVEGGDLYLTAFHFFNRGAEVRGIATIHDIQKMQDAAVDGTFYGSIRALKDFELPLLRSVVPDIDAILSALQNNGVSVVISGTIKNYQIREVLFAELDKTMHEFLLGDFKNSAQHKAPSEK